jgi:hypothetical protein
MARVVFDLIESMLWEVCALGAKGVDLANYSIIAFRSFGSRTHLYGRRSDYSL